MESIIATKSVKITEENFGSSSSSITLSPLGYNDNIKQITNQVGYWLGGYYIELYGAYGTYCNFYLHKGKLSATNLHPTATATLIGKIVLLWIKI